MITDNTIRTVEINRQLFPCGSSLGQAPSLGLGSFAAHIRCWSYSALALLAHVVKAVAVRWLTASSRSRWSLRPARTPSTHASS